VNLQEYVAQIVTVGANEVVAVPFPYETRIRKLIASISGAGAFNLTAYNRNFVSSAVTITSITDNGSGKCRIRINVEHYLVVGDVVTVSGSSVGGYNVSHTITAVDGANGYFDTSVAFSTVPVTPGSYVLAVATYAQVAYEVIPQQAASSGAVRLTDVDYHFVNRDRSSGANRNGPWYIYLKFSVAGTYFVSLGHYPD